MLKQQEPAPGVELYEETFAAELATAVGETAVVATAMPAGVPDFVTESMQPLPLTAGLNLRQPNGRYAVGSQELIAEIRSMQAAACYEDAEARLVALIERCQFKFFRHARGLSHRPDLQEEVVANMTEHLVREVLNPAEHFLEQNFTVYLERMCSEEFSRLLTMEGLRFKRNDDGKPIGRQPHVPRVLIDTIDAWPEEIGDGHPAEQVPDTYDGVEEFHANAETERILAALEPLDQKIMRLRVIEGLKWNDVAVLCHRSERQVRLRFERSRIYMQEFLGGQNGSRPEPNTVHMSNRA